MFCVPAAPVTVRRRNWRADVAEGHGTRPRHKATAQGLPLFFLRPGIVRSHKATAQGHSTRPRHKATAQGHSTRPEHKATAQGDPKSMDSIPGRPQKRLRKEGKNCAEMIRNRWILLHFRAFSYFWKLPKNWQKIPNFRQIFPFSLRPQFVVFFFAGGRSR